MLTMIVSTLPIEMEESNPTLQSASPGHPDPFTIDTLFPGLTKG